MESICISMHRCLGSNHPIFRLLAPHFQFLLAINWWVIILLTIVRELRLESCKHGDKLWREKKHRAVSIAERTHLWSIQSLKETGTGTGNCILCRTFTQQLMWDWDLYLSFGIVSVPVPLPYKFCLNNPFILNVLNSLNRLIADVRLWLKYFVKDEARIKLVKRST